MTSRNISFMKSLEGRWVGEGRGRFPPNIPEFRYVEELEIRQGGKPAVFEFRSATRNAETGGPMHVEVGFIRCPAGTSKIEMICSHPFGLSEISHGILRGDILEFVCDEASMLRTSTTGEVKTTQIRREYVLDHSAGSLVFTMDMATDRHPTIQNHLLCTLRKQT